MGNHVNWGITRHHRLAALVFRQSLKPAIKPQGSTVNRSLVGQDNPELLSLASPALNTVPGDLMVMNAGLGGSPQLASTDLPALASVSGKRECVRSLHRPA